MSGDSTKLIRLLIAVYSDAETKLLKLLADQTVDADERDWARRKLAAIDLVLDKAREIVERAGNKGDEYLLRLLAQEVQRGFASTDQLPDLLAGVNVTPTGLLTRAVFGELRDARLQILRSVEDIFRAIIEEVSFGVVTGVETRKEIAASALAKFAQDGITAFVDAAGRRWDIASYVEMATRTAAQQAFREGRIRAIVDSGDDLAVIRSAPSRCPNCSAWRNKVLSISGTDPKYPPLQRALDGGVFHPNCRCTINKYIPGLTRLDVDERVDNYYDAEQEQRRLERELRAVDRVLLVDPANQEARERYRLLQDELEELLQDNPELKRKPEREAADGVR
ncbi:MAG: hypothetical protein KatS3mg109_2153 [Pirellulaceae bacterium]|nr:MAG: hypothetical protein KatS3mg109_2153 [Pirellulaceae bacterium]